MSNNKQKEKRFLCNVRRALSCFFPLFPVFLLQNIIAVWRLFERLDNMSFWKSLWMQNFSFWFNVVMIFVWLTLGLAAVRGSMEMCKVFLGDWDEDQSTEIFIIKKAENNTADFYFTYFSLFVLSFFSVDPTQIKDCLIFVYLMILIIWVYIVNELYHINPFLNICGYRFFTITACKNGGDDQQIRVLSKDRLDKEFQSKILLKYSPYDFTAGRLNTK